MEFIFWEPVQNRCGLHSNEMQPKKLSHLVRLFFTALVSKVQRCWKHGKCHAANAALADDPAKFVPTLVPKTLTNLNKFHMKLWDLFGRDIKNHPTINI